MPRQKAPPRVGVREIPDGLFSRWLVNDVRAGDVVEVQTPSGSFRADRFLLAAGAWTEALLEPLGWKPGIRPVRGQIALLHTGTPLLRRILLWGARYLVPRPDGRVLVGSTEEDVGFSKRTTASAVGELLTLAGALVPGLAEDALRRGERLLVRAAKTPTGAQRAALAHVALQAALRGQDRASVASLAELAWGDGALLDVGARPVGKGPAGGGHGQLHVLGRARGHAGHDLLSGRIDDLDLLAGGGPPPLPADQHCCFHVDSSSRCQVVTATSPVRRATAVVR